MPGSNVSVDFWAPIAWPADGFSLGLEPMYQYIDDIMMTYLQLAPSLSSGVDIIYTFADSFHATPGTLPSIDGPSFSTRTMVSLCLYTLPASPKAGHAAGRDSVTAPSRRSRPDASWSTSDGTT